MDDRDPRSRRRFLAAVGAATAGSLSGCAGLLGDDEGTTRPTVEDFRGENPLVGSRSPPGGTPISDLPDLEGPLTVYLGSADAGRHEQLLRLFERYYPRFVVDVRVDTPAALVDRLRGEQAAGNVRADVFWTTSAAALQAVARDELLASLPGDLTSAVPDRFAPTDRWVGVGARSRAIAYDTRAFDADDVPRDVDEFAARDAGRLAWAPRTYTFQAFVTALRHVEGADAARAWLSTVLERDLFTVDDGLFVADAVARSTARLGLLTHTDVLGVRTGTPEAPVGLAFTANDAGALVDAASAGVLQASASRPLGRTLVRHLLSAEAQEFFATRGFDYPVVAGVPPVDALPPFADLHPPDVPLTVLGDVDPTTSLLRDVGVLP